MNGRQFLREMIDSLELVGVPGQTDSYRASGERSSPATRIHRAGRTSSIEASYVTSGCTRHL